MLRTINRITVATFITLWSCNDPIIERPQEEPLVSDLVSCDQTLNNESLASCGLTKLEGQFEIWTWNLEFFPQTSNTPQSVVDIIGYYQPDIIAFQEINSRLNMQKVLDAMDTYEGWVVNLSGDLDLAFAYNTCRVSSYADPTIILQDVWPRPPALWTANINGEILNIINIHLKCCNDGVSDRQEASEAISAFMKNDLADEATVLLGDYNDEIDDTGIQTFLTDSIHFRYADEHVSFGSELNWSYPSWPSDIDHILINQPLFDKVDTAATLLLDQCIPNYSRNISDHRIVSAIINL